MTVLLLLVICVCCASFLLPAESEYLSLTIIQLVVMALPAVFYCKLTGGWTLDRLCCRLVDFSGILFSLICTVVLVAACALLRLGMENIFPITFTQQRLYGFILPQTSGNVASILFGSIVAVILPAFLEEFVYHSILFTEYASYGMFAAMILSSFLYALTSLSAYEFPIAFLVGVLSSFVFYVTRSVFPCIIVRLGYGFYTLFLQPHIREFVQKPDNTPFFVFIAGSLFFLFLILAFGEAERVFYKRGIANEPSASAVALIPAMRNTLLLLLSPAVLVSVGLFVGYVVLR